MTSCVTFGMVSNYALYTPAPIVRYIIVRDKNYLTTHKECFISFNVLHLSNICSYMLDYNKPKESVQIRGKLILRWAPEQWMILIH